MLGWQFVSQKPHHTQWFHLNLHAFRCAQNVSLTLSNPCKIWKTKQRTIVGCKGKTKKGSPNWAKDWIWEAVRVILSIFVLNTTCWKINSKLSNWSKKLSDSFGPNFLLHISFFWQNQRKTKRKSTFLDHNCRSVLFEWIASLINQTLRDLLEEDCWNFDTTLCCEYFPIYKTKTQELSSFTLWSLVIHSVQKGVSGINWKREKNSHHTTQNKSQQTRNTKTNYSLRLRVQSILCAKKAIGRMGWFEMKPSTKVAAPSEIVCHDSPYPSRWTWCISCTFINANTVHGKRKEKKRDFKSWMNYWKMGRTLSVYAWSKKFFTRNKNKKTKASNKWATNFSPKKLSSTTNIHNEKILADSRLPTSWRVRKVGREYCGRNKGVHLWTWNQHNVDMLTAGKFHSKRPKYVADVFKPRVRRYCLGKKKELGLVFSFGFRFQTSDGLVTRRLLALPVFAILSTERNILDKEAALVPPSYKFVSVNKRSHENNENRKQQLTCQMLTCGA